MRVDRAAMLNNRTYTLEDHPEGYVPEAQHPVICDQCSWELHPRESGPKNWKAIHALNNSPYRFTYIDYAGSGIAECWCCHTHSFGGRHLVQVQRKHHAA